MAGPRKEGDLYLASNVDVVRGTRPERMPDGRMVDVAATKRIAAGQMVSDTDLTPDEVKGLKLADVVRVPTDAESKAMDAREDGKTAAAAAAEAAADAKLLAQDQENERARLAADQTAEAQAAQQKLADKQEKERTATAGKKK